MKTLQIDFHEAQTRVMGGRVKNAVMNKLNQMFFIEDQKALEDALHDSNMRVMYSDNFGIIKFSQKRFSNFMELLIQYQEK